MLKSLFSVFLLQCFLLETRAFSLSKKQERFTCPTADGFYGIDGQCTAEYYACVGGVAYPQTCPGTGNVFDPQISKCVPYESASCRNTGVTTTTTSSSTAMTTTARHTSTVTTTEPSGPTFSCPTTEGFFAIPNTCGPDYYVCVSGSPYVSTCPGETIFDPVTLICTSLDQASCKPEFVCPSPDGFFPVPGTCGNNYYSCVGGTAYLQSCPGNAVFDPATNNCVLADSASCKNTTTSITTPTTTPTTTTTTTTTTTPKPTLAPFVCPGPPGLYPYPDSCTLYYVCSSGGNYIVASCPEGQVFDPSTQYCDYPTDMSECSFDPIRFLKDLRFVGMTGGPSLM